MMLQSYKGRELPKKGQLVKVYFSLHDNLFSIVDMKSGLVVAHGNNFYIDNPVFKVSEKRRQKVLETRTKNVHAYTIGYFAGIDPKDSDNLIPIYYNPFNVSQFMVGDKEANEMNFQTVLMQDKRVFGKLEL